MLEAGEEVQHRGDYALEEPVTGLVGSLQAGSEGRASW